MLQNRKIKDDTTFIVDLSELLSEKINGKIVNHHVEPLMPVGGENFGSEMVKIDVTVEDSNGNQTVLHGVGKLLPSTELQREMFSVQVTFKSEIGFYSEIVPTLIKFQAEHGMASMEYFAELLGARTSLEPHSKTVDENAVIILENLKLKGFHNQDRLEGFDLESTKKVLQSLANLQATTLSLRKKQPELFETKVRPHLHEPRPLPPFNYDKLLTENLETATLVGKIHNLLNKSQRTIIREPWATVTHNDFWINNIMITNKADGTIDKIKLIDFQMPDYSSPVRDVIFFLFSSVSMPVLRYHLDKLLQYYFTEFISVLKKFDVDLKEFTYESFLEELRLEGGLQVHHSLFMVPIILAPKEKRVEPNNSNKLAPPLEGQQHFTSAMKEKIWFIVAEAAKRNWI
ncbi:uncharacterized protein LOC126734895 [Anthonomus grandis grandis]|uniref:uncharacterized protein LOC126734895 n=1 Tax=Anthonomus grandis grandis TaxID=2921223 RepID=UPI002165EEE3|nr:uncharacterized protein LOC126734895 [Anthonomus grandis grandis]